MFRPLLLFPLMPIVFFTWWVARQYLHVSRELKRLESLKKSPVFVLFSETLQVERDITHDAILAGIYFIARVYSI